MDSGLLASAFALGPGMTKSYQWPQILARHAHARRGHPRLKARVKSKTWMAGTSAAMTKWMGHDLRPLVLEENQRWDNTLIRRPASALCRPSSVLRSKENRALAGPVQVRRRGGADDTPSRGEQLPASRLPIWEDEATACHAALAQYASRISGTQRDGGHASHAVIARCGVYAQDTKTPVIARSQRGRASSRGHVGSSQ